MRARSPQSYYFVSQQFSPFRTVYVPSDSSLLLRYHDFYFAIFGPNILYNILYENYKLKQADIQKLFVRTF